MELPGLFIARFFAESVLCSGRVVPVSISMRAPQDLGIRLGYELTESAPLLSMRPEHLGEWYQTSPRFWRHLDAIGPERITSELAEISVRHNGLPLALCDWEDVVIGHQSPRVVFSAWAEENMGVQVDEITDDGETIPWRDLHRQTQPKRPREEER